MFQKLFEEADDTGAAGGGGDDGVSAADEQKARQLGWVPQDEWQGDPEKWRPASDFLTRGEEIMPLLKANNRRLHQQVSAQSQEMAALRRALEEQQEILRALQESNAEISTQRKEAEVESLTTQIAEAREANNVALEAKLQAKLTNLTRELEEPEEEPVKKPRAPDPQAFRQEQWWQDWIAENPWYEEDENRTIFADALSARMRQDPANRGLTGKAFLDKMAAEVEKRFPSARGTGGSARVEAGGGRGAGGNNGGNGHSYADLPAAAKAACDKYAKKLVGTKPGQFKTEKEYRENYARKFFGERS
jgi:hypothetical protein